MRVAFRIELIATLVALGGCGTARDLGVPTAYESAQRASLFYAELSAVEAAGGFPAVNARYAATEWDVAKLEAAALWMRDAYRQPAHDPRYGLLYADLLVSMARLHGSDTKGYVTYMESGAIAFYSSELIAREDLARCAEADVGLRYLRNWTGELEASYRAHLASLDASERERLVDVAIGFAARRHTDEPDRAACGSGRQAMRMAMEQGRCRELPADPARPGHREYECDGGDFAELVPDARWQERREQLRTRYRAWVLERVSGTASKRGGS